MSVERAPSSERERTLLSLQQRDSLLRVLQVVRKSVGEGEGADHAVEVCDMREEGMISGLLVGAPWKDALSPAAKAEDDTLLTSSFVAHH